MKVTQLVKTIVLLLYPLVVVCDYLTWNFEHNPDDKVSLKQSGKDVWKVWEVWSKC